VTREEQHPVEYLETAEAADRFVRSIADETVLALDTEGASFHRFVDRIYLLQLSAARETAIIDPLGMDAPPGLGALLENPAVEVIFHDADYDLRLLHQDYGWHVNNVFDTRIAAQLLGIRAFGLAALLERYFGVRLDKKHQRADWSMRPLTPEMLHYAAQDTRHLIELRSRMRDELERAGRAEWAREEFRALVGTRWDEDDAATAYLRIKGARDLSRRELAVLRELVAWREETARELDRATFRVMSNETLFAIARAAPATREMLAALKGISRGIIERRSADVLGAVQRGLAVQEKDLPKFPRAPRFQRDPDFDARATRLKAIRDRVAVELDLEPGVLCSRERLEAIARRRPESAEELRTVPELRRWQIQQLGEDEILDTVRTRTTSDALSRGAG
jgi:ribonuclease D